MALDIFGIKKLLERKNQAKIDAARVQNLLTSRLTAQQQPQVQPVAQPVQQQVQPVIQPAQPQLEAVQGQLGALKEQAEKIQAGFQEQQPSLQAGEELTKAEEAIKAAQARRLEAEKVAPEEQEAEQTLQNLLASKELGLQRVREKPIPLEFITGQQRAIESRAATQAAPLQARLSQLQAKRQATIGSAKLGVEEAESLKDIAKARFERGKPVAKTQTEKDRLIKTEVIKLASPKLIASRGTDGYVSPQVYMDLRQQYATEIGNVSGFDDIFSPMLSPQERARLFTEKSVATARAPSTARSSEVDDFNNL